MLFALKFTRLILYLEREINGYLHNQLEDMEEGMMVMMVIMLCF